jgi:replicative DNA helicase
MSMDLESHEFRVDAREAMPERMQAYEARVTDRDLIHGMRIGFPQIDNYTRGIHPGELAVLAAGPKVGKSFMMTWVALEEWKAGRVTTFFTLENSVEMTLDRLACFATGVRPREWQAGQCSSEDVERMEQWIEELRNHDTPLHIIQPGLGQRSTGSDEPFGFSFD